MSVFTEIQISVYMCWFTFFTAINVYMEKTKFDCT